jgi:hypothetical protein
LSGVFPNCDYLMRVTLTLKPACAIFGILAVTIPAKALTSAGSSGVSTATNPSQSSTSKATDDGSNPYGVIVERNVFHLNPPPPPPEPAKPKLELPVVKITGFVNIAHTTKGLFVSQPKDKKAPYYYSLTEGEEVGDGDHTLKLVKIYPGQKTVDIINDGVAVTLNTKDDSYVGSPGAAPAAAPAAATAAAGSGGGSVIVAGGATPSPAGGGGGGVTTIGGGGAGSQGVSSGGASGGVTVAGGYNPGGAGGQLASLLTSAPSQGQVANPNVQAPASPEAQAVGMLSDATQHPDNFPPLPPDLAQMIGQDTGTVPTPHGRGAAPAAPPPP